jgi:hypothetical protein
MPLELRLDKLLDWFKRFEPFVLDEIHNDPMLTKRYVGDLIIANASKELFSPTTIAQQIAKGVVYTKVGDKFKLVSMPLCKMWNSHEMQAEQDTIINSHMMSDLNIVNGHVTSDVNIEILSKIDGSMISRFVYDGKVYFSTRGVIQGSELESEYIQAAIDIATEKYPLLLDPDIYSDVTLIFELIFPEGRVITNYGDTRDLILTACFSLNGFMYHRYVVLEYIAQDLGLALVESHKAQGHTINQKMDNLLSQIKGTDAEGFMMTIERDGAVVYRVKFKGEDYIRKLKIMNQCTYKNVVQIILNDKDIKNRSDFKKMILANSGDDLPPGVIEEYMSLHDKYVYFYEEVWKIIHIASSKFTDINKKDLPLSKEDKKEFALKVKDFPYASLLFRFASGSTQPQIAREIEIKAMGDIDYLLKFTEKG